MAGLDYTARDKALWAALLALCLASAAAYVLWALPAMPETVPTHWGVDGTADGWDSKGSTILMGALMPILMLALLFAVPHLDPRGASFNRFKGVYEGFSAAFSVFMVIVAWITPLSALGVLPTAGGSFVNIIVFGFLGLLFVGLGIDLPRIEPNYTFGVRLPWTLADPENWRRTHRFAGPVFVIMGVVTLVSAFLASAAPELTPIALLVALLGGVGLITLYSFLLWKGVVR
ncbi:MAG TPA: SdpI family protein [Candidatus Olsenella excrementavium]|uniref:SdpI family protein n=1 Tax=Candidatus Olsenella excrementavium TaxID=2838709 RepID=A0A9D1Z9W2_9ACTN|nr:SdpI family protein [Candidatus Olsenella excrementavium]